MPEMCQTDQPPEFTSDARRQAQTNCSLQRGYSVLQQSTLGAISYGTSEKLEL